MVNLTIEIIPKLSCEITKPTITRKDVFELISLHLQKNVEEIQDLFYFIQNGSLVKDNDFKNVPTFAIPRLLGGKGGFGSMLRAIGAQIEKTTNREACRDLSGRRLRDINEEKRLKNWISQQANREEEKEEKKKKKIQRLCAEPKYSFHDPEFEKQREILIDNVCEAVEQGFKAKSTQIEPSTSTCASSTGQKRKQPSSSQETKAKKKNLLWMDSEEEALSSSSEQEVSDSESSPKKKKVDL